MPTLTTTSQRLTAVFTANALLRIANAAGGALVGFYLAALAAAGRPFAAALVGTLGIIVNSFELLAAIPFGILADRLPPRRLLFYGGLLGAVATQLFGLTGWVPVFYLARALEGTAAAATGPPLLRHLTDLAATNTAHRGRISSYFELSLLIGLAFGTLAGGLAWDGLSQAAFTVMALLYLLAGLLFWLGVPANVRPPLEKRPSPLAHLQQAWANRPLRQLLPAWLAANAIVGLWLTHLVFQLSSPASPGQYLVGRFSATQVGLLSLFYALLTGTGILVWGRLLGRLSDLRVMQVGLWGTVGTAGCFYLLNHATNWPVAQRTAVIVLYLIAILVQSGVTPAALAYLMRHAAQQNGRGAVMGIYTLLLGLGNLLGAAVGGWLASRYLIDGLVIGSLLLSVLALLTLPRRAIDPRQP